MKSFEDEISLLKQSFQFISDNIENKEELKRFLTFSKASDEAKQLVEKILADGS